MKRKVRDKPNEILLADDSLGDVRLCQEAFKESEMPNKLNVVHDGVEAMSYLRREGKYADARRPDIILLDLNMPKMDGREVLAEIKTDERLKRIPVVILTVSAAEKDITNCYNNHANCYITKPVVLEEFIEAIKSIWVFWFNTVKRPVK
ncbi:MAG: response regulator [Candidatus Brocadiales bacterium]